MASEFTRSLHARLELAIDRLRPALVIDGGNVELIDVDEEGTVRVALQGAFATSAIRPAILALALEPMLRAELPEVTAVIAV